MAPLRVYFESGERWVFACAADWPGWARRGKGEEGALEVLLAYADRYAGAVGAEVPTLTVDVIGRVPSRGGLADFGAPGAVGPWDDEPLDGEEMERQLQLLQASWDRLDAVAAAAPPELRKGPRGGGRDRDKVLAHVREAERAYASKGGFRIPIRTPWDEQREMVVAGLRAADPAGEWPVRYNIRRMAWHIIDHVWEIEDRAD